MLSKINRQKYWGRKIRFLEDHSCTESLGMKWLSMWGQKFSVRTNHPWFLLRSLFICNIMKMPPKSFERPKPLSNFIPRSRQFAPQAWILIRSILHYSCLTFISREREKQILMNWSCLCEWDWNADRRYYQQWPNASGWPFEFTVNPSKKYKFKFLLIWRCAHWHKYRKV